MEPPFSGGRRLCHPRHLPNRVLHRAGQDLLSTLPQWLFLQFIGTDENGREQRRGQTATRHEGWARGYAADKVGEETAGPARRAGKCHVDEINRISHLNCRSRMTYKTTPKAVVIQLTERR